MGYSSIQRFVKSSVFRVLCFALCIICFVPYDFCTDVFAATLSQDNIFVSLDFDSLPTNASPYGLSLNNMNATVVSPDNEIKDKAVCVRKEGMASSADIPANQSAPGMVFDFEFMADDFKVERSVQLVDTSSALTTVFSLKTDGSLILADGKKLMSVKLNKWYRFSFVYRFAEKRYDVYLDGKYKDGEILMTNNTAFGQCMRLRFAADGGGFASAFYLDDIRIYSGTEVYADSAFPKSTYNPDITDSTVFEAPNDTESVFINTDFNSDTAGERPTAASAASAKSELNTVAVDNFPSETDKSLLIHRTVLSGPHADFPVSCASAGQAVLEFDYYVHDLGVYSIFPVNFRDELAGFNQILVIAHNGGITVGTRWLGTFETDKWQKIRLIINFNEMRYDAVYLDGELIGEMIPFANMQAITPSLLRIEARNSANLAKINIDNLRLYAGNKIKTNDELLAGSANLSGGTLITSPDIVENKLKNTIAFKVYDKVSLHGTQKEILDTSANLNENTAYVPLAYVVSCLGGTAGWDAENMQVSADVNGKSVLYTYDSAKAVIDGVEHKMSAAATLVNGRFMIPAEEISQHISPCQISINEKYGIVVLDFDNKNLTSSDVKDIYDYMTYTRPSAQTVLSDYEPMKNVHPRIIVTDDTFGRIKKNMLTDKNVKKWAESVIADAEAMLTLEPTKYELTSAEVNLLAAARQHVKRTQTLSMAYKLTDDSRYTDFLWKELESVCNFKDWFTEHFLDTAEMAMGVAIGYDWCYDVWTAQQRKVMEDALMNLALLPARDNYDFKKSSSTRWVLIKNNWNIVCNSGMTAAALALMDIHPEFCSKLISDALISLENSLGEFAPDGAWGEGPSYWDYSITYLTYYFAALKSALGTDYGYLHTNGIEKTCYYMMSLQNSRGAFNMGDAGAEIVTSEESFYFANLVNDPALSKARLDEMEFYNVKPTALDLIYFDPENVAESSDLPLDWKWRDVEVATFRDVYGENDSLFTAIHGGYNNATHQDIDAGSFVLYALGEKWVTELGQDSYGQAGYWDITSKAQRYYAYRKSSQGNNVLALNPIGELGQEQLATAKISDFKTSGRSAYAILDMTDIYGARVTEAKRGILVDDARSRVTVRDELDLRGSMDLWWFAHIPQNVNVTIEENGRNALLEVNGKQMYVIMQSNAKDARFTLASDEPLNGSGVRKSVNPVTTRRLQINVPKANGKIDISVRFIPISYDGQLEELKQSGISAIQSISRWTLEEGEMPPVPSLDFIEVNGRAIDGFSGRKTEYAVSFEYGTMNTPEVSASASDVFDVQIVQAESPNGTAEIKVTDKNDDKNSRSYFVKFKVQPLVGRPESGEKLEIFDVQVSSEPQAENSKVNVIDGDKLTRWSAQGYQEWMILDLGKVKKVDALTFAFYLGTERVTYFDISLSEDGVNWNKVYNGESSGQTDDYESYAVGSQKARYIKIDAKGTNIGSWNSFSEIEVYGN